MSREKEMWSKSEQIGMGNRQSALMGVDGLMQHIQERYFDTQINKSICLRVAEPFDYTAVLLLCEEAA